ncbi:hypothetical protein ACLOJK_017120, partial [Asimina triloba]
RKTVVTEPASWRDNTFIEVTPLAQKTHCTANSKFRRDHSSRDNKLAQGNLMSML